MFNEILVDSGSIININDDKFVVDLRIRILTEDEDRIKEYSVQNSEVESLVLATLKSIVEENYKKVKITKKEQKKEE